MQVCLIITIAVAVFWYFLAGLTISALVRLLVQFGHAAGIYGTPSLKLVASILLIFLWVIFAPVFLIEARSMQNKKIMEDREREREHRG